MGAVRYRTQGRTSPTIEGGVMARQTYPRRPQPGQCDCSLENPCDLHNGSYDGEDEEND